MGGGNGKWGRFFFSGSRLGKLDGMIQRYDQLVWCHRSTDGDKWGFGFDGIGEIDI